MAAPRPNLDNRAPSGSSSSLERGAIPPSIDSILSKHAKTLRPGETITFTLVKGPMSSSVDPLLARAASAGATAPPDRHPFPRMAKFVETVEKPDFSVGGRLRDGRMYEEDAPKVKDESDDEEEGGESNPNKPKKRRWRKNDPPRRHWILQEKSEFVEKMNAKRRRRMGEGGAGGKVDGGLPGASGDGENVSSRYEGAHEANPSRYVLLSVGSPPSDGGPAPPAPNEGTVRAPHPVAVLPVHGFHSFAQPAKFATLSMHEAEQAITDQRNNMSRYMMHGKMSEKGGASVELMAEKAAASSGGRGRGRNMGAPPQMGLSKARLLGKLSAKVAAEEDDDIMVDLAYRERKGGSAKARKELLSSLGDKDLTVDDDGVLGGANDTEFGGRRRFGRLAVPNAKQGGGDGGKGKQDANDVSRVKGSTSGGVGNDGLAMAEDFYHRDMEAEYDELDYDAKEQFDDDDVDVVAEVDDSGGFAAEQDEDDFDDDEYDEDELADAMLVGLASAVGLKALNAKARGETVEEGNAAAGAVPGATEGRGEESAAQKKDEENAPDGAEKNDSLAKIMAGAAEAKQKAEQKRKAEAEKKAKEEAEAGDEAASGPAFEFDDNGQRIITLGAVRREIWLQNGAITTKRLMKIFDIKKKTSAERQNKFREVVKELCTMKLDNVEGNMLVLKQHYAKMG